jgi:hypothetical protein
MGLRVIPASAKLNRRHKAALFLTLLAAGALLVWGAGAKQTAGGVLLGLAFAWALGSNNRLVHLSFVAVGLILGIGPALRDWYDHRSETRKYRESVAEFERRIPDLAKQYPAFSLSVLMPKKPRLKADIFDPVAEFKSRYAGVQDDPDEKVRKYLSDPHHFREAFPEYKSWDDTKIREMLSQYIFLPDGRYGKFRADTTDEQIVAKIEELFPGTFNDRKPTDNRFRYVALPDGNYLKAPSATPDEKLRAEVAKNFPVLPRWEIDARIAGVDLDAVLASSELPRVEPDPYSLRLTLVANWMFELPGALLSVIGIGLLLRVKLETPSILK